MYPVCGSSPCESVWEKDRPEKTRCSSFVDHLIRYSLYDWIIPFGLDGADHVIATLVAVNTVTCGIGNPSGVAINVLVLFGKLLEMPIELITVT